MGRRTEYEASYPIQVRRLVSTGASWRQIADYFGVAVSTVFVWSQKHPEFAEAIRATKDEADLAVEKALFQRATGYTVDSVKIFQYEGTPVEAKFQEHVPPDVNAIKLWLTNRKPKEWRERVDIEHSGSIDLAGALEAARKRAEQE